MSRKILMGCYEVPGYGGANTVRYRLFRRLREEGWEASYVNLVSEEDVDYFTFLFGEAAGNPDRLDSVFNCTVRGRFDEAQPDLAEVIARVQPDVMVASGYIAALIMKRAAPDRRLILLTCGCQQVKQLLGFRRFPDYLALQRALDRPRRWPARGSGDEKEAVDAADLVIAHCPMVRDLYLHFFSPQAGKILPEVLWVADDVVHEAADYAEHRMAFDDRDVDALFVASAWTRQEKNYPLLQKVIAACPDLRIHVAGEVQRPTGHAVYHGLVRRRDELFRLMGRSRAVVCPSRFDAAPGVLFEASAMGCNVVASRNCGNWALCHEDLLADPCTARAFVDCMRRAVQRPYPDHRDRFQSADMQQTLRDILALY